MSLKVLLSLLHNIIMQCTTLSTVSLTAEAICAVVIACASGVRSNCTLAIVTIAILLKLHHLCAFPAEFFPLALVSIAASLPLALTCAILLLQSAKIGRLNHPPIKRMTSCLVHSLRPAERRGVSIAFLSVAADSSVSFTAYPWSGRAHPRHHSLRGIRRLMIGLQETFLISF